MRSLASYMEVARQFLVQTSASFNPAAPWSERIESYRTWCLALKMLAYGHLLVNCNAPQFFVHLFRAAANWRELLASAQAEQQRVPASMNDPFLGAIAAGQMNLALDIADLSARELTDPEYDDEFLSAFFLQEYVRTRAGRTDAAPLELICQQLEDFLGEACPRTEAYRALVHRDWAVFDEAFRSWTEETAASMADPNAPGATFSSGITRHIWLEGLAVFHLARAAGFESLPESRPLLPQLILQPPQALAETTPWLLGQAHIMEDTA